MMKHILLFDAECPQCSSVARRVRELAAQDLETKSLTDPAMVNMFAQAGQALPTKPALVHVREQGLSVRTGLAMRISLAKLLGPRRAAEIIGLVGLEVKARLERHSDTRPMSRRNLLGGAVAGAGALVFGTALPANAQRGSSGSSPSGDNLRRLLDSSELQQARAVWGAPELSEIATAVTPQGTSIALVPHKGTDQAFTAINLDEDSPGVTVVPSPSGDGIRYYLSSGTPLAELTVQDGDVVSSRLGTDAAPPVTAPEPQGVQEFTECFLVCVGLNVGVDCVSNCISCAIGNTFQRLLFCPRCAICAGSTGIDCANQCRDLL